MTIVIFQLYCRCLVIDHMQISQVPKRLQQHFNEWKGAAGNIEKLSRDNLEYTIVCNMSLWLKITHKWDRFSWISSRSRNSKFLRYLIRTHLDSFYWSQVPIEFGIVSTQLLCSPKIFSSNEISAAAMPIWDWFWFSGLVAAKKWNLMIKDWALIRQAATWKSTRP